MKRNTRVWIQRCGAIALMACATLAIAGTKFTLNGHVVVRKSASGSGQASGVLSTVHNAATTREYIGCQAYSTTGGIFCHAVSESGVDGFCATSSQYLAESLQAAGPDVQLIFSWNASGVCDSLIVRVSSQFEPKH